MKKVRIYITPDDVKNKLGDEYKNSEVIITNHAVGNDGCLEFECLITEEKVTEDNWRHRIF